MDEVIFDCELGRELTADEIAERRAAGTLGSPVVQDPEGENEAGE